MSASDDRTKRVLVTILFVVIGLPPGLCSLYFGPQAIPMLLSSNSQTQAYGALFGFPSAVGLLIFLGLLFLMIRAWRRKPS
jgi:hypothetical protein